MKWISCCVAAVALGVVSVACADEFRPDSKPPQPFRVGNGSGLATIEVVPRQHAAEIAVNVAFECTGGLFTAARNPFFLRNQHLPARVLVFDAEKKYVGDLVLSTQDEELRAGETMRIMPGMALGCQIAVKVTDHPTSTRDVAGTEIKQIDALGPGEYFLQAAYTEAFYKKLDSTTPRRVAEGRVLGRSELTKLTLPLQPPADWERMGLTDVTLDVTGLAGKYESGDHVRVRFTSTNSSNAPVELFNPFLGSYYRKVPYGLELVNAAGKRVRIDRLTDGSIQIVNHTTWIAIPPGGLVAHTKEYVVPGSSPTPGEESLVGEHHLQLAVYDWFVSPNPFTDDISPLIATEATTAWYKNYTGERIATSRKYLVTTNR